MGTTATTEARVCIKCGHEERFSDNEGGTCEKLGTEVVRGGEGVVQCGCYCQFPSPQPAPDAEAEHGQTPLNTLRDALEYVRRNDIYNEAVAAFELLHQEVKSLRAALRQTRNTAQVFIDSKNLSTAQEGLRSIVRDVDAALASTQGRIIENQSTQTDSKEGKL